MRGGGLLSCYTPIFACGDVEKIHEVATASDSEKGFEGIINLFINS